MAKKKSGFDRLIAGMKKAGVKAKVVRVPASVAIATICGEAANRRNLKRKPHQ